jgi:hypothetical protein
MAFLAPLAAGAGTVGATAGAAALAKAGVAASASGALGAGITAGTALGGGAMAAMPALSYAGANLAAPGILGALPSAVAPTAGIFAKAAPALGGLSSFTPAAPGIFAKASPALGGLSSFAPTATKAAPGLFQTAGMSPLGGMQSVLPSVSQVAPNVLGQNQVLAEFSRQGLGQNLTQLGPKLAGRADSLAFKPVAEAPYLNTFTEGAALPNVTSNLPAATYGNVAGGPAIPNVTSGLPVSTTQVPLVPGSVTPIERGANFLQNFKNLVKNPSLQGAKDYLEEHPYASAGAAYMAYNALQPKPKQPVQDKGMIRPYEFAYNPNMAAYATSPTTDSREQLYFDPTFTALEPVKAAEGGIMGLAVGGPVETMSAMNAVGSNMMYPQAQLQTPLYSNPLVQRPEAVNVLSPSGEPAVGAYSGEQKFASGGDTKEPKMEGEYKYSYDPKTFTMTQLSAPRYADTTNKNLPALYTGPKTAGGIAPPVGGPGIAALMPQRQMAPLNIPAYQTPEERLGLTEFYPMMNRRLAEQAGYAAGGGVSDLGGYSDGGRLLKGPGDGVSDSIPAVIGNRQPARLADGEFVIPARIVSELGNGSTEAGARKLYAMMDRVQKARGKTVGKNKIAANTKADKHLPA